MTVQELIAKIIAFYEERLCVERSTIKEMYCFINDRGTITTVTIKVIREWKKE